MRTLTLLKTVFTTGFIFILCICFSQNSRNKYDLSGKYYIEGNLLDTQYAYVKVYLTYTYKGEITKDSSWIQNNSYHFKGFITEPIEASLEAVGDSNKKSAPIYFFLDTGIVRVVSTEQFDRAEIKGSAAQLESEKLNELLRPVQTELKERLTKYRVATRNKQDSLAKQYMDRLEILSKQTTMLSGAFAKAHPTSRIALTALELFSRLELSKNINEVEAIYKLLPQAYRKTYTGTIIYNRISDEKKTSIGSLLKPYTLKDTSGKGVNLSSFKGKYVLLDFWASWCVPCRKENPTLVAIYDKYKGKELTMASISLDKPVARDKWIEAIKEDKLSWSQLSEYTLDEKPISNILGIHSIPFNLLLDKKGKIVAKNLRGRELEKYIESILIKDKEQ